MSIWSQRYVVSTSNYKATLPLQHQAKLCTQIIKQGFQSNRVYMHDSFDRKKKEGITEKGIIYILKSDIYRFSFESVSSSSLSAGGGSVKLSCLEVATFFSIPLNIGLVRWK